MGKQIRFFMDAEDERLFLEFVRKTPEVVVLPDTSPSQEFMPLDELPDCSSDDFSVILWLFNRRVSSRLVSAFVPEQNHYTIDRFASSVIEFGRTIRRTDMIRPGRLWVDLQYLDSGGKLVSKEPEFKKWYESLVRWIRKDYSREVDPDFYFGPGALQLAKSGKVEVRYY